MDEKELSKLNRKDLLAVLLEASKENEELHKKLEDLENQANEKEMSVSNCDTIAEASLQMHDIFNRANAAAQLYLDSVKANGSVQIQLKQQAEEELKQVQAQCAALEEESKKKCADIEAASSQKCSDMLASATKEADDYRAQINNRIDKIKENYENIFKILQNMQ